MLDKILSNLPFNPSMFQQLSFYAKRVRQERTIRRVGLVFIVLAFLVQFFAFVSPPQSSLAYSSNDLINGGFGSASDAYKDCINNLEDYQQILAYYGITCTRVLNANTLTINSDDYPDQGGLWSMGHNAQPNFQGQSQVTIPGLMSPYNSIYERPLKDWDLSGPSTNYPVLNVTSTGGQTFFLMYGCGNLVSVAFPQPVQKKPVLQIQKTTIPTFYKANSQVGPGAYLGFRIYYTNSGGPASNVYIRDPEPTNTSENYIGADGANDYKFEGNTATWYFANVPGGSNNYVDVVYKVNTNTANNTQICNTASISSDQTSPITSNPVCMTVIKTKPVPPPPPPPKKPPKPPKPPCEQNVSSINQSACITIKKTASNLTTNVVDANGTTAQAGNIIRYTLYATNIGSVTVKNYVFEDNLSYVLDYSQVIQAKSFKIKTPDEIIWPAVDIKANQTIAKSFEVRVDNPIPQTPTSTSDPNYFNLTMSNTFGNTITINLPGNVVHTIQTASTTLPNTGPGESVILAAIVVGIAGFFFYRSRLLAKEANIAISEQHGGII